MYDISRAFLIFKRKFKKYVHFFSRSRKRVKPTFLDGLNFMFMTLNFITNKLITLSLKDSSLEWYSSIYALDFGYIVNELYIILCFPTKSHIICYTKYMENCKHLFALQDSIFKICAPNDQMKKIHAYNY